MTSEFNLIELIAKKVRAVSLDYGLELGIGDDAAVMQPSPGMQLVTTADNLVQGRHFDDHATADEIGHLALAVNLSDLAAMGATPRWSLLTLTLPEPDLDWLDSFIDSYLSLSAQHQCALVGGNITRGPLNIAVTAIGEVTADQFISRTGAQAGDRIVVTGTLGDAAAALTLYDDQLHDDQLHDNQLRTRLLKPTPRVGAGQGLREIARAMIDVSDGLLADLSHLLGSFGAQIWLDQLPTSEALKQRLPQANDRWPLQLNGGGDYELLALLPEDVDVPKRIGDVSLREIGRVTGSGKIECINSAGELIDQPIQGWDHFSGR